MWPWFTFALITDCLVVAYLIKRLPDKSVTPDTKAVVAFGWAVPTFLLALVPLDVAVTIAQSDRKTLVVLYEIPYFATQLLTWLLLPFFQLYSDAGDFTVKERLKTSAKENAMFYGIVASLGIVSVFILVVTRGISFASIVSGGIAISVSFSVCSGILLMGYGMAEIPRSYWFNSSLKRRQQWCEHQVGKLSDRLDEAHTEFGKVVWSADKMSTTMPRRHHLRWAMDIIDESIKKAAVVGVSPDNEDGDDEEYDYEDIHALASMRRRLNRAFNTFERAKFEFVQAVVMAIEVGDIVACRTAGRTNGDRKFKSSLRPPRTGPKAEIKDRLEYYWKCQARRYIMRMLSVLFWFTSFVLVLAECTIWLSQVPSLRGKDVSIISLMIESDAGADLVTKVIVGLTMMYMFACTYFTIFRLAMFSFFHVVPGHTDAISLTLTATLFCRYSAALCYNILSMLPVVHKNGAESVFEQVIGSHLPRAAVLFIDIFPVVLAVFWPMASLGVLDKLKGCCSKSRFRINDEGIADETTTLGRAILDRERDSIRGGAKPGETHAAFSTRRKEGKKKSGFELNRFFQRGKKEGQADEEAAREEQKTSLLAAEREEREAARGPPMTRAEELKARLAAKAEAVRSGGSGSSASHVAATRDPPPRVAATPPTVAAAPPPLPPRPAAVSTPVSAPATSAPPPAGGSSATTSLDAFFASLSKR